MTKADKEENNSAPDPFKVFLRIFRLFIGNTVFALNVLLSFLVFYRNRVDIPVWLQPVGRMHPMLLHLPIGLLLLSGLMILFRNGFKKKAFHNFLNFVLYFSALTAALTAIMGLILSREGGYNEAQLNLHLWTGFSVSLCAAALLWISLYLKKKKLFNTSLALTIVLLLITGHLGSILTHGENFVLQPLNKNKKVVVTDSTSLYDAAVHPILEAKCMSCHNERKLKGKLNMATVESLLKGGEDGPVFMVGDPDHSEMIKRVRLPEENDDHMPPAGKTQLTTSEMKLLYRWILEGADFKKAWTRYDTSDSLSMLATLFIHQERQQLPKHYSFPFAAPETIQQLNTPYLTVAQLASDEPALKADFFLSQAFNPKSLEALLKVKEQIVTLNLAKMPVTDAEGKVIQEFKNLEKLNLNQTKISITIISALKHLHHLHSISLAGTAVDKDFLTQLATLPSLQEVFIWNTKIASEEKMSLQKQFPKITWDQGYQSKEVLRLTPPLLLNESLLLRDHDSIRLKHNLRGTQIRYTLDGSDPDSTSGAIYEQPISINKYSLLKTKAFKEGWYGSPTAQFYFFKRGIQPLSTTLLNPPDKAYKGEGSITLTDNKKGTPDNFKDIAWLGFREKPFIALFDMNTITTVKTITLSYCEFPQAFLFPPAWVELWSGDDPLHLQLRQRIVPSPAMENSPRDVKGIVFDVPTLQNKYFKIIAQPIAKVPVWVSKKKEKGWVFIDEVIFN